jgi:hypothetical protein
VAAQHQLTFQQPTFLPTKHQRHRGGPDGCLLASCLLLLLRLLRILQPVLLLLRVLLL